MSYNAIQTSKTKYYYIYYNIYNYHIYIIIHTYHSRYIPQGVAEASQIFLRHVHVYQNDLAMKNAARVTGGNVSPSPSDCSLFQVRLGII
jgi:hypothetical protein